ncbi:hypothetical protein CN217_05545 [Sinorhizobium meliloti]|nr:hypothetical protein CN217_05545 [Sinorhizobium meliloti]
MGKAKHQFARRVMPPQGDDFQRQRWSKSNAGEAAERCANDDPNDHRRTFIAHENSTERRHRAIAACGCVSSNSSTAAAIVLAQPQIAFDRSLEDTPALSVSRSTFTPLPPGKRKPSTT